MDWRVTPPKPVTSPTWGAPHPHADQKIDLFVTLSIVYIQILNTYLLEFLIARLMTLTESAAPVSQQVKGSNPVQV